MPVKISGLAANVNRKTWCDRCVGRPRGRPRRASPEVQERMGKRLKYCRELFAPKLEQLEAALFAGVSLSLLQKWERGERMPLPSEQQLLAASYGCLSTEFDKDEKDP